ncbi:MAG: FtsQ-type POTRA domain-containing protein [Chitinophagaceae bacterium]
MKKVVRNIIWSLLAIASVTLLIAAMRAKNELTTAGVVINIQPDASASFLQEADVNAVLQKNGVRNGAALSLMNLNNIEQQLQRNPWIKKAEVFVDNKQILHAEIILRTPLARIFTVSGNSFYIDTACTKMPALSTTPARLILFTSFPSDKNKLSVPDSLLMQQVKKIATYISTDSFWMAQTAQVDISTDGKFILIPVLGNQEIILGNADNLDEKFRALMAFYQQAWKTLGFEKYSSINVEFSGQVVATRRGAYNAVADTSLALKLFANSENKMKNVLADTVFAAPIKSLDTAKIVQAPTVKKNVAKPIKEPTQTKKIIINKKPAQKIPKAVLKKPTNE